MKNNTNIKKEKGWIILLSDANNTDLKSKPKEKFLNIEKLVKNEIIIELIMNSTVDECFDSMTFF